MRKILIVGATSAIAQATARRFAAAGDALFLVARNPDKLAIVADDLRARGAARVTTAVLDVTAYECHETLIDAAWSAFDGVDAVLIAHGTLPDQRACEESVALMRQAFETNTLSVLALLVPLARRCAQQRHGTLCVISSVAGDRGRQSNYVYGAAKAAVSTFMQGLRNRLHASGVRVITIKPGLVDTPMTANFPKGWLWSPPEVVAAGIYRAITRHKDVVYLPWFWRPVMLVIRGLPERLFKRLPL